MLEDIAESLDSELYIIEREFLRHNLKSTNITKIEIVLTNHKGRVATKRKQSALQTHTHTQGALRTMRVTKKQHHESTRTPKTNII